MNEAEYKKQKKEDAANEKELEMLGKRIEPYWDKKAHDLKKDAPEEIKKDYKRFLELFDETMLKR